MSEQNNKMLARRVFEEVFSQGKKGIIDELVTSDYVGHTPIGTIDGPDGASQFADMLRFAYPDLDCKVEEQIAEGDKVATLWKASGTHKGEFQGVPPTGKEMEITGITIFRIADGKLVEGWTNPDMLSMLQQIGAIPEPERSN